MTTTIPLLANAPKINGQYADGRFAYDQPLPVPGAPVQEIRFGVVSYETMHDAVVARKAAFDANQAASLNTPAVWLHVGFTVDPISSDVCYFYQHRMAFNKPPAQYWANYPTEPQTLENPWP